MKESTIISVLLHALVLMLIMSYEITSRTLTNEVLSENVIEIVHYHSGSVSLNATEHDKVIDIRPGQAGLEQERNEQNPIALQESEKSYRSKAETISLHGDEAKLALQDAGSLKSPATLPKPKLKEQPYSALRNVNPREAVVKIDSQKENALQKKNVAKQQVNTGHTDFETLGVQSAKKASQATSKTALKTNASIVPVPSIPIAKPARIDSIQLPTLTSAITPSDSDTKLSVVSKLSGNASLDIFQKQKLERNSTSPASVKVRVTKNGPNKFLSGEKQFIAANDIYKNLSHEKSGKGIDRKAAKQNYVGQPELEPISKPAMQQMSIWKKAPEAPIFPFSPATSKPSKSKKQISCKQTFSVPGGSKNPLKNLNVKKVLDINDLLGQPTYVYPNTKQVTISQLLGTGKPYHRNNGGSISVSALLAFNYGASRARSIVCIE